MTVGQRNPDGGPVRCACPGRPGASSCSRPRRRCSSPRATTPPRWTTSPSAPGVSKPVLYQHFPGKLDLYLALLDTHCDDIIAKMRAAMSSSTDNKLRVAGAMSAYFDFVDQESEAFRLVFESDLRNEPAVRERFERVERGCFEAITETIMADTGLGRDRAELLAAGLCGAAEIAARFWLTTGRKVPKPEAEALLAALSWRGHRKLPPAGRRPLAIGLACEWQPRFVGS